MKPTKNDMKEIKRLTPISSMTYKETIPEHDCWYYAKAHYLIGLEGTAKKCGICDKILEFRYRSFWKRLWRVFVDF